MALRLDTGHHRLLQRPVRARRTASPARHARSVSDPAVGPARTGANPANHSAHRTRPATAAAPRPRPRSVLTTSWGVWLGSAALLLAGVFLVRYAVEQELLGPAARCGVAALLGLVLLAAAEFLHRHEGPPLVGPFRIDQAPSGLAAGGTAILFGAAYGAGPFFGLLPPLLAFAAMAAASLIALASALRYGPLTAATGIAGAFATPALVATQNSVAARPVRLPVDRLRRRPAGGPPNRVDLARLGYHDRRRDLGGVSPPSRPRRTAGPPPPSSLPPPHSTCCCSRAWHSTNRSAGVWPGCPSPRSAPPAWCWKPSPRVLPRGQRCSCSPPSQSGRASLNPASTDCPGLPHRSAC